MATTLRRKALEVDGAWLLTEHDGRSVAEWIFAAIGALTPLGWKGTPLATGGVIDRVEFSNDSIPLSAKQATAGQWVVLDRGQVHVLTAEECEDYYDEVEAD